jgi:hypothetical protein
MKAKTGRARAQTLNDRVVEAIIDLSAIHMSMVDRRDLTMMVRCTYLYGELSLAKVCDLLGLSPAEGRLLCGRWHKDEAMSEARED